MIPTIEVSHLPSSSSFYAAVTQPLGIHFLCASPSSPHSLHFGIPAQPSEILFTLTESASPRPSTLTLTASNATQVSNFHSLALESNTHHSTNVIHNSADSAVAKSTDLDGNMLEVRYARSPPRKGSINVAPTTITTASTAKEARRVLDWQRNVARSISTPSPTPSREHSPERAVVLASPQSEAPSQVAHSQVSRSQVSRSQVSRSQAPPSEYQPQQQLQQQVQLQPQPQPQQLQPQPQQQQQQQQQQPTLRSTAAPVLTAVYNEVSSAMPEKLGEGLSSQAIIGTIIGAAAGAAVAYAMVRSEEPEPQPPKPQLVTYFTQPAQQPQQMYVPQQQAPMVEVARSKAPSNTGSRAMSDMGGQSQSGQRYVLRYNVAQSGTGTQQGSVRNGGYLDPVDERRIMNYASYDTETTTSYNPKQAASQVSSARTARHSEVRGVGHEQPMTVVSGSQASGYGKPMSVVSGSQASRYDKPMSAVSGSQASRHEKPMSVVSGSQASRHEKPMSVVSGSQASRHSESMRSHVSRKTDSTVKPAKPMSKAGSEWQEGSIASMKSDKKTTISERARRVPLPESVVGSVAPSDSISNIGMRSHYSRRDVY